MLSRQRSGLPIFGVINILGSVEEDGRGKNLLRLTEDGNQRFLQRTMLYSVLQKMRGQDRVVTLPVRAARGTLVSPCLPCYYLQLSTIIGNYIEVHLKFGDLRLRRCYHL